MLANGREQKQPWGRKPSPNLLLGCASLAGKKPHCVQTGEAAEPSVALAPASG